MTTTTPKQWQRRAIKAEAQLDFIQQMRSFDSKREMDMARQLAMCKTALKEAREAITWALEEPP